MNYSLNYTILISVTISALPLASRYFCNSFSNSLHYYIYICMTISIVKNISENIYHSDWRCCSNSDEIDASKLNYVFTNHIVVMENYSQWAIISLAIWSSSIYKYGFHAIYLKTKWRHCKYLYIVYINSCQWYILSFWLSKWCNSKGPTSFRLFDYSTYILLRIMYVKIACDVLFLRTSSRPCYCMRNRFRRAVLPAYRTVYFPWQRQRVGNAPIHIIIYFTV